MAAVEAAVAEDPDGVLPVLALMSRATDPVLRARVQALVPRLILERARTGPSGRLGSGRLRAVPADRGGDLELDLSLEAILTARGERRAPRHDELTAVTWQRPATALCLLVDRSGSMDGHRLATAAMAAAACALRIADSGGELSIAAFDRRAEVVVDIASRDQARIPVERVLGLRGHGMTSLQAALSVAGQQLGAARARRRITVLLSDCRVTDDLDPLPNARSLDELVVIAPASDDEQARAFARDAGARVASLESIADLPRILDDLLAP